MLSFGIRFGEGLDRNSILKVMQSIPAEFDYDLLVIGSSPGGVACAREARLAGKKTAIIRWRRYTPAEEEGVSENLEEMAGALEMSEDYSRSEDLISPRSSKHQKITLSAKSSFIASKSGTFVKTQWPRRKNKYASRKVRRSRLDLNNALFRRGEQCRKLMRIASNFGDAVVEAEKCGWRVVTTTPKLSMNWNKMSESIMDYVMEEDWKLVSMLAEEGVQIIEGGVTFVNEYTVQVRPLNTAEYEVTANTICLALSADYVFPEDVVGAECFGINCDDFYRMIEAPGKTLIVGSTPEAIECAGIVANCRFPVTVIASLFALSPSSSSRSRILKGYDSEISQMIVDDLKRKGVVFLEDTTLKGIDAPEDGEKILANFIPNISSQDTLQKSLEGMEEKFDTVIFAVGKRVLIESLKVNNAGISLDPINHKVKADLMDATTASNIYAIGDIVADRPVGFAVSELAGRLLGQRLFNNGKEIMDYSMLPFLLLTPTEYAFVGLSEDDALYRLGSDCVSIYYGSFAPLDFVIPRINRNCFAKVIVFKPKDRVIGLHFYGPDAGEMIQGFAAAVKAGLTMTHLQTLAGVPTTKAQEILRLKNLRVHPTKEGTD